jgi:hypothetical protein
MKKRINEQLKHISQAEHSMHRSLGNFITNLVASLITYLKLHYLYAFYRDIAKHWWIQIKNKCLEI